MERNGEAVPEAIVERNYSGKFQVRVAPETHRQLVIEAAEKGVSLSHLAATRLASP
nr:toxin-antitoxin system HicB family antitoxin [Phytoactinopolyspora limicola]